MISKTLLSLCAGIALLASARADSLVPKFDDSIPPASPAGDTNAFPTAIPCGKTLLIPVAASNPSGGALTCTATSSNPSVMVRVRTGDPVLNLGITHSAATSGTSADLSFSGTLQLMLFREFAPKAAGTIGGLAQAGYYDHVVFHRIIPGFMAQGGDPDGTGGGGPGFTFEHEFKLPLLFTGKGQLAMARLGNDEDSNGSQFFVTYNNNNRSALDLNYTLFGQLLRGWDTFYQMSKVTSRLDLPLNSPAQDATNDDASHPLSDVTITSAKVTQTNDAVLILSATGAGSSTITVTITDSAALASGTATPLTSSTSFTVMAVADTFNDPAVLPPPADAVIDYKKKGTFLLQAQDLEFDARGYGYDLLTSATDNWTTTATGFGASLKLEIMGNPAEFTGTTDVHVVAAQIDQNSQGTGAARHDNWIFRVGLGDKALTPIPANLSLASGTSPALIVAGSFLDKDGNDTAASFLKAEINWGDGSVSTGSTAAITKDLKNSKLYTVSGSHAYAKPGIYPLAVSAYSAQGATAKMVGVANVSDGTMLLKGYALSAKDGKVSKAQVATFQDLAPALPTDYKPIIDWGDGVRTSGSVVKVSGSTFFKVIGSHRYADSATYPVSVSLAKAAETETAWSTANAYHISKPAFLPPFPQAHLTAPDPSNLSFVIASMNSNGQLTAPTGSSSDLVAMSGQATIRNIGSATSLPATLYFYVTGTDGTLATTTQLGTHLVIPAIKPGSQATVKFKNVVWPDHSGYNFDYVGRSIVLQCVWTDPLAKLEFAVDFGPYIQTGRLRKPGT